MTEAAHTQLVFSVGNNTKAGLQEIKNDVRGVADAAAQAGQRAGAAFDGIGKSGEEAAAKLSRSESAIAAALRRSIEQMELAQRQAAGMADAFDFKIGFRGIDTSKLQPAIDHLRQLEAQISVTKAAEAEFAAQNAFAQKHSQAAVLAKSSEYTSWWVAELDKAKVAESEIAAQNAFAAKHLQARELAKASQYASWWAAELEKVEAAERKLASETSFLNSLKAQTDAIGKTRADLLEMQAAQMGVSSQAAPFIAKLRETEQGLGKMGVSAGQTRAALQQLPLQFQDIVVSLQGGQAPFTVFLQQGSQIAGSFGGAGAALKATASYVLGLVNPFTVAAAVIGTLALAYYQGSKEQDAFVRSLTMTGNAAGMTTDQLRAYSREISESVGTQGQAAAALVAFIDAGVRGNEQLQEYAKTAVEWEAVTGQAAADVAKQFKDLQDDPLKAVVKLNEGMNFLTVSVYEQIKSLEEQGKKSEAAKVAMDALNSTMKERSAEIKQNLGYIEGAWNAISSAAAKAWDRMLGVGREATLADKIGGLKDDIAAMEKQIAEGKGFGNTAGGAATGRGNALLTQQDIELLQKRIALRKEELGELEKTAKADKEAAEQKAKDAEAVKTRIAINEKYADALKVEMTLSQKLAQAREDAAKAGWDEEKLKRVLANITEEHNKKNREGNAGRKAAENSYKTLTASINAAIVGLEKERDTGEKLSVVEKLRLEYAKQRSKLSASRQRDIELLLEEADAALQAKNAAQELAKAWEDDAKALDAHIKKQEAQIASVISSVEKLRLEEEAHLLAEAANISHAEAVERLTIARLEEAKVQMLNGAGSTKEVEDITKEIEKRKELLGLLGQKEAREANAKAAKDAAKEWDKTSQTIGDTLADYIMGGGKDAATYLKRLFSTLVLQPVVQYGVNSAMGALGMGQQGSAVNSVLGGNNVGTTVLNNAGAIGAGFQAMYGMSVGASSASLLGANAVGMVGGDALGALIAGNGAWAGVAVEAGATAGAAAGSAAAASGASGVLSTIGAAAPWIAGGLVALKLIGGMLGGGTSDYGAAAKYSGGAISDTGKAYTYAELTQSYAQGMQGSIDGLAQTVGTSLDALATMFGKQSGYSVQTGFTSDNDDPSRGIFIVQNPEGEDLKKWLHYRSGEFGQRATGYSYAKDAEKGYDDYLKSVTAATIPIFKDIVPAWAGNMLDSLTASLGYSGKAEDWKSIESGSAAMEALNATLQQIAQVNAAFDSLGQAMKPFAGLTDEMKSSLLGVFGTIDNLTATASTFYNSYYTEAERMETLAAQMQSALSGLNVQIDPRMGDVAKAQFKEAVEAAFAAGKGELGAQLLAMNQSFATAAEYAAKAAKDMQQAALAVAQSAVDGAFANFEAAVERERTYWDGIANAAQDAVGKLSSTLSLLTSNAQALYGTVDSTQQMLAAQGMVYIEDALAGVLGGASASSYGGLQDAINAARGGISNGAYATQFDRDRDTLVLAGQLSQLGELTDSQLSIEERALKAANKQIEQLDKTLEYWQQALDFDALNIDATLTVAQAVMALGPLITALQLERAGGSYAAAIKAVTPGGEAPKAALYQQMLGSGLTDTQIRAMVDKTTGVQTDSDWDYLKKLAGLPGFASGGMHTGGLRVVGERGWEIEATGPSRIWNQQQLAHAMGGGNGGNAELVAAIDRLTQQNEQLTARLLEIEGHTRKSAQVLVDVTNDGNAMVSEYL